MPDAPVHRDAALIEWLNAHESELERYAGRWIAIHRAHGIVAHGTIGEAEAEFRRRCSGDVPVLYHVPPPGEGDYGV